jgi:CheY-like chemotaxis protein
VSRILVADDNSNIQKMVALALKDEGIDVVAVGNGEAAMRKIPDLRPDLVLADIFMPVRNGYEVCEFVKSDSRYMSTPVVLLVGAFDPLDEQETQRVRADGVLKKPFVPPDPLINMVKALLAKNGQKPLPVPAVTPVKPVTPAQTTPVPVNQPSSISGMDTAATEESRQRGKASPSAQQPPPPFMAPTKQPAPQTANIQDADEVVTSARDANLGDPFWATPEEPQELEEKTETQPQDMLDMHSFGKDESSVEPEEQTYFRPDSPLLDADLGADVGATIALQNEPAVPQQTSSQPAAADEDDSNTLLAPSEDDAPPSSASLETPIEMFKFDPTLTFPDATPEAPAEDAAPRSATTHATAQPPAAAGKPVGSHAQIEPIELELPPLPDHDSVITAATEAARLAFSELNTLPSSGASVESSDRNTSVREKESLSPSVPAQASPPPTPEMIEAVVSRLLERMQPEIMEVVNREVLRPAIEAMVRRVMEKD